MSPAGEDGGVGPVRDDATSPHRAAARAAEAATFVEAMRRATTASPDLRSHAARIAALELSVARSPPRRRAHVAALSEAALEAEAAWRISVGLPPTETRLFAGWIDLPSTAAPDGSGAAGEDVTMLDVDDAISRATVVVRGLLSLPGGSEGAEPLWDRLEEIAFAPCFETSASCLGGRDRRRSLLILWSALRRRRPFAAAVMRRCLALDRAWRAKAAGGRR